MSGDSYCPIHGLSPCHCNFVGPGLVNIPCDHTGSDCKCFPNLGKTLFIEHGKLKVAPEKVAEKTPHKCPVCEGRGNVPFNFYRDRPDGTTYIPAIEECRSCQNGILWR